MTSYKIHILVDGSKVPFYHYVIYAFMSRIKNLTVWQILEFFCIPFDLVTTGSYVASNSGFLLFPKTSLDRKTTVQKTPETPQECNLLLTCTLPACLKASKHYRMWLTWLTEALRFWSRRGWSAHRVPLQASPCLTWLPCTALQSGPTPPPPLPPHPPHLGSQT